MSGDVSHVRSEGRVTGSWGLDRGAWLQSHPFCPCASPGHLQFPVPPEASDKPVLTPVLVPAGAGSVRPMQFCLTGVRQAAPLPCSPMPGHGGTQSRDPPMDEPLPPFTGSWGHLSSAPPQCPWLTS